MVKRALWRVMLIFDMVDKLSPNGKSIAVSGACLNRAVMWAIMFVRSREVHLKILDSIERFPDRTSMNIASAGLDSAHEMGMPGFDVSIKFVFSQKSEKGTGAARIRALEFAFFRMAFQVTREVMLSRKPFPVLASRDITPM